LLDPLFAISRVTSSSRQDPCGHGNCSPHVDLFHSSPQQACHDCHPSFLQGQDQTAQHCIGVPPTPNRTQQLHPQVDGLPIWHAAVVWLLLLVGWSPVSTRDPAHDIKAREDRRAPRECSSTCQNKRSIGVMDTPRHKWLITLGWRAGPVAARKPDSKGSIGPGWHLKCPQTLAHVPPRLALPCPSCRAHRILERWTVNQAPGRKMLPGPIAAPEIACYLHMLNLAGRFGTLP
jgi:hypothetical protein